MPEESDDKVANPPNPKLWNLEVLLDKIYCSSTTFDDRPLADELCLQGSFAPPALAPVVVGPYSMSPGQERTFTPPLSLGVLPLNPAMAKAQAVRWAVELDPFGPAPPPRRGLLRVLDDLLDTDDTFGHQFERIAIAWNAAGPTCTITRGVGGAPPPPPPPPVVLTPAAPLAVVIPYVSPAPGGPPPASNLLGGPAAYTIQISYRLF